MEHLVLQQYNNIYTMNHKINCNFAKEANGNAKLTQEQVDELKYLREQQGLTQRALAAQFNISKTQAHRIINNLSWSE